MRVTVVLWLLFSAAAGISSLGTYGLASGWAARPSGHWFLRTVPLLLLCGAWLLVPDYQLSLLFVTFSLVVMLTLRYTDWDDGARHQPPIAEGPTKRRLKLPRFTVADLLLTVVIAAVVFAIVAQAPGDVRSHWYRPVLLGTMLAVVIAFASWADSLRRARKRRKFARYWVLLAALPIAWPGLMLYALPWLTAKAREGRLRGMAAIAAALCVAPPIIFYSWAVRPRFLSRPTVPSDNGYDDFVRAGELLLADKADIGALTGRPLRDYLARHQESLRLARKGLSRPCCVPWPEGERDPMSFDGQQQVARLFMAEGRWNVAAGRFADATKSGLDAIRFGQLIASGGLTLDNALGVVYELDGLDGLRQLVGRLDEDDCARLAKCLSLLVAANRESFDDVLWRERRHNDLTRPWTERLIDWQLATPLHMGLDAERSVFETHSNRVLSSGRLLLAHIALRRYRLSNAAYPPSLEEIVPRYLDRVPIDSFSGKSLIYHRLEDGYQLYSVGRDRRDDGGIPVTGIPTAAAGDLLFDVATEPSDY
jgi:hypothetical protein